MRISKTSREDSQVHFRREYMWIICYGTVLFSTRSLKVMPPIFFQWKPQQIQNTIKLFDKFSATKHSFSTQPPPLSVHFFPEMNMSLHATLSKICTAVQNQAFIHVSVATAESHHPPTRCTHIHCLVSINIQQVLTNVKGEPFFQCGRI